MNVYIYQADILCEDCGEKICKEMIDLGMMPAFPDDESSYDSNEYPEGPYEKGGGEADWPQHCGNGKHCLNAIELSGGVKVGTFLENPLTAEGYRYLLEQILKYPTEVTELWAEYYCDDYFDGKTIRKHIEKIN